MWTSPSWWTPMSTNAPKLVTLVTMPGQTIPGCRSLSSWMSARNANGTNVSRGSRPGFSSSRTRSSNVNAPTSSRNARASFTCLTPAPSSAPVPTPSCPASRSSARVALRVDAGVVERVGAARHAQEARRLLEHLLREARHLEQAVARLEQPVLAAVVDDGARQRRPDPRHVRQEVARRRVHVDAHLVHARIDHGIEALLEARLRHVVLVLPDADALGIDLHQLGQRILQAARDRDGAAHGDVQLRELLARDVAGAVDAGARLADHHHRHVDLEVPQRLAHEGLGLAPGGAVADGDGGDVSLLHQVGQHRRGGGLAGGRLQVHQPRADVAPRRVDHRQLAAGAQPRIDAEHRLRSERRGEQQLADVLGEHGDRRGVGDVAQRLVHLGVDRRRHVRAQGQARRPLEQRRARERRAGRRAGGGLERARRARRAADRPCAVVIRAARPASAPALPPSTRAASPGSGASSAASAAP